MVNDMVTDEATGIEYEVCPRCEAWMKEPRIGHGRRENQRRICPACSADEGLRDAFAKRYVPEAEWPTDNSIGRSVVRQMEHISDA